ncbi:MAG: SRPBCC family protein [Gemmatimonadales bacterium]|jgi:uncharacterized protein YndB with AHSA1/START domain|nr:MAG: SRPBCC family protein [Gemmatimonadales bacterium]
MTYLKGFISVLALGLLAFVGVGLLLSGEWSAERQRFLEAPPETVFTYLEDLALWAEWSTMEQVEGELSTPSHGVGATLAWDDPQWGQGRFELVSLTPVRAVEYRVSVEGGAMETRGRLDLIPEAGGTTLTWREEGDFGWNPLLAYFALGMERMQGAELDKALDRLERLVEG